MAVTIAYETKTRSAVKSFIWRLVGIVILASVTYFYTHKWITTSWITFLHHGIFFFVFILHERFYLHVDYTGLKRKLIKCFTYETILGQFILGIITLVITGNIQTMGKITLTYIGIKHLIFIGNEFIWDKVKFGRRVKC